MQDLFGREIKVGHFLSHGAREGNSGKISVALVEKIVDNKIKAIKCDVNWAGKRQYFRSTLSVGSQLLIINGLSLPTDVTEALVKKTKNSYDI